MPLMCKASDAMTCDELTEISVVGEAGILCNRQNLVDLNAYPL